ncbi:MAG: EutN/CcmL family microcompartment protein [Verrucomicrobia bacterium]|nr:EutN/CcmL family microcompartment protein [Verrucomicrobiota bacterium]MDA1005634.1 EutN/CcmL family microcompartment protein [Verrucomicrobiota bacterium]
MRIGQVIGRVVMSRQEAAFKGARWLLVHPLDAKQFKTACDKAPTKLSRQSTAVVYDNLGAGQDDIVGFVEGAEATAPFDDPTPIDAITVAIFDHIHYVPYKA